MFEKFFSRPYEMFDFPHFVPLEEMEHNKEFAKIITEQKSISGNWNFVTKDNNEILARYYSHAAKRIVSHGGLILDICSGPDGGFMPAILNLEDFNAHIMINDLCPTVVKEWHRFLTSLNPAPPNVEYAAFNVCDIPFADNSIDVIAGYCAIINIEGGTGMREKALKEIYRVLKKGGLFVMSDQVISKDQLNSMAEEQKAVFLKRFWFAFADYQDELDKLGYTSIETEVIGTKSTKTDHSTLADYANANGAELVFSRYNKYCIK